MCAFSNFRILLVLSSAVYVDGDCWVPYCRLDSCEGLTCTACLGGNYLTNGGLCSGCWPYCTQCTEFQHCTQCAQGKWGYLCEETCLWCDYGCYFDTGTCLSELSPTKGDITKTSMQSTSTKKAATTAENLVKTTNTQEADADTGSGTIDGDDNQNSLSNNGNSKDPQPGNQYIIQDKGSDSNTGLIVGVVVSVVVVAAVVIVVVVIFYRRKNRKNGVSTGSAGGNTSPALPSGMTAVPVPVAATQVLSTAASHPTQHFVTPGAPVPHPEQHFVTPGAPVSHPEQHFATPSAPVSPHVIVQYTSAPPYGNPAGGYISPTYTGSPNAPAVPIIGSNSYPRPSAPPQLGTAAGPVIGSNPHPRPSAPSQLGNAVRFAANAGRLMGGIGGITGNCSGSDLGTMDSGYAELM